MPRSDRAYTTWQVTYKPANAKKPAVNVMAVNITLLYYGFSKNGDYLHGWKVSWNSTISRCFGQLKRLLDIIIVYQHSNGV